jgi:ubiquinone/menaquinone biosynthesis C-methylase UbiE
MIPRVLEPEAMETAEEVRQYDAMDHSAVNDRFVADFLSVHGPCRGGEILDVGTGTARIPIALAGADGQARIVALDLSATMLAQAAINIARAGLSPRITCRQGDAKSLLDVFGDSIFEGVVSNTIIHHIPDPAPVLEEIARLAAPGGTVMVRDLARPGSQDEVARLVAAYAGKETPEARYLFQASLNAALTLDEARSLIGRMGLSEGDVIMTSDRHWTWTWRRPGRRDWSRRDRDN